MTLDQQIDDLCKNPEAVNINVLATPGIDNFDNTNLIEAAIEMVEMDTDSNYFAFSEDSIEKLIKPEMRAEYEKEKYSFLPSESNELHPTFNVDGKPFTLAKYDKRTPGLFKEEKRTNKLISLCSKTQISTDSIPRIFNIFPHSVITFSPMP